MIIYRIEPNGKFFYEDIPMSPADYIAEIPDKRAVDILKKNQVTVLRYRCSPFEETNPFASRFFERDICGTVGIFGTDGIDEAFIRANFGVSDACVKRRKTFRIFRIDADGRAYFETVDLAAQKFTYPQGWALVSYLEYALNGLT